MKLPVLCLCILMLIVVLIPTKRDFNFSSNMLIQCLNKSEKLFQTSGSSITNFDFRESNTVLEESRKRP